MRMFTSSVMVTLGASNTPTILPVKQVVSSLYYARDAATTQYALGKRCHVSSVMVFSPTLKPSMTPSAKPDSSGLAKNGGVSLPELNPTMLSVILVILFLSVLLAYYIFAVRHGIELAALDLSDESESYKKKLSNGLVTFGRYDLLFSIPLAIVTFMSNCMHVASLLRDDGSGGSYQAAVILMVRLVNAMVAVYLLHSVLYRPWLSQYLNGVMLHNGNFVNSFIGPIAIKVVTMEIHRVLSAQWRLAKSFHFQACIVQHHFDQLFHGYYFWHDGFYAINILNSLIRCIFGFFCRSFHDIPI